MSNNIFVFTLQTKSRLGAAGCLFDNQGRVIGRILKTSPTFKDEYDEFEYDGYYSYDIESLQDTYEKIKDGQVVLDIEDYNVSDCSKWYTRKED